MLHGIPCAFLVAIVSFTATDCAAAARSRRPDWHIAQDQLATAARDETAARIRHRVDRGMMLDALLRQRDYQPLVDPRAIELVPESIQTVPLEKDLQERLFPSR